MVVVEWGEHCWGEVSTLVCQLWPNLAATRVAKKTVWTEIKNVWRKKLINDNFCDHSHKWSSIFGPNIEPSRTLPSAAEPTWYWWSVKSHVFSQFSPLTYIDDLCQELHATGLLLNSRVGFDCHICYLTLQTVKCLLHIACDIIKTLSNVNFFSEYYDISIIVDDSWSPNSTDLYFWYSFVNIQIRKT